MKHKDSLAILLEINYEWGSNQLQMTQEDNGGFLRLLPRISLQTTLSDKAEELAKDKQRQRGVGWGVAWYLICYLWIAVCEAK